MAKNKKIKDIIGFETKKEEDLTDISAEIIKEAEKIQDLLKEEDNDD